MASADASPFGKQTDSQCWPSNAVGFGSEAPRPVGRQYPKRSIAAFPPLHLATLVLEGV